MVLVQAKEAGENPQVLIPQDLVNIRFPLKSLIYQDLQCLMSKMSLDISDIVKYSAQVHFFSHFYILF